jgi:poly(3-hydroxybutyrate) depolymerase
MNSSHPFYPAPITPLHASLYSMALQISLFSQMRKNVEFVEQLVKTHVAKVEPTWATANEEVLKLNTLTLRKFSNPSQAPQVPILVLPPFAGHNSTIADFHPKQSLIGTLMHNGHPSIYATDWHSATEEMQYYRVDDYLSELNSVVDEIGEKVNLIGLCQGGWFGAIYTARYPKKVNSLVIAGAPIDTQAGNGFIKQLANQLPMSFYEKLVQLGGGVLKGDFMLTGFKSLHPFRHYFEKYWDLYVNIDDEKYVERFDNFERWYEFTINLPGAWYLQVVEQLFKENRFVKGEFVAQGKQVSPASITCPVYLLAGEKDDITPPEQVFDAEKYLGTPTQHLRKGLAKGGHIGLFMGHSVLNQNWTTIAQWLHKYNYKAQPTFFNGEW